MEKRWSPDEYWHMQADCPVPPRELCSTAYCFGFKDGKMALTRHHRGWDIPGGHVEPGESAEDAARREMYEETGMTVGDLHLVAVQLVHQDKPHERNGRPYPFPEFYGMWYTAPILAIGPIPAGSESFESRLFTPVEIRDFMFDFEPCFEEAMNVAEHNGFLL
jgi:8-oxo-dGTP pyrophosphatase MutT (NUDIX family)